MVSEVLKECSICPRDCRVNRLQAPTGYCKTGSGFHISSICIHRGEEPVIDGKLGICNIFFTGCNLHCIFCQNHEISFIGKSLPENQGISGQLKSLPLHPELKLEEVIQGIIRILDQGISAVGFVTPSHVVPQVKEIISELRSRGRNPVFVYNTNAYDKAETIRDLENYIDVFLPDFKYMDASLASRLSDAPDYPDIALASISEMYRLKSSSLIIDEDGQAESGLIIRHLVIPGQVSNSLAVLRTIAEKISTGVCISLMSQYHPNKYVKNEPDLNRCLYAKEYQQVADELENLGFRKGYFQDIVSSSNYTPDFSKDHPFIDPSD
jgi:putative pyruvate formate lyase activating enzyme